MEDLSGSNVIVISRLFRQPRNKQKQGRVRPLPSRLRCARNIWKLLKMSVSIFCTSTRSYRMSRLVQHAVPQSKNTNDNWNTLTQDNYWLFEKSNSCQYPPTSPPALLFGGDLSTYHCSSNCIAISQHQCSVTAGTGWKPSGIWTANIPFGAFKRCMHRYLEAYQGTTRTQRRICWRWRPGLSRCPRGRCSEKCWRMWRGGWTAASLRHNDKHTDAY